MAAMDGLYNYLGNDDAKRGGICEYCCECEDLDK